MGQFWFYNKCWGQAINATKLDKGWVSQKCGTQFFVTIFKIQLDKSDEMCGPFANRG